MTLYDDEFYSVQRGGSERSARSVLPVVFDLIHPKSVVDVGCGVGTWLAVASELGAESLVGFEGDWVKKAKLAKSDLEIRFGNLENQVSLSEKRDLAICLEVAEHLSSERGPSLISDLCALSDVVLFGAALPRQGGTDHINEQWPSYWAAQFAKFDFRPYDVVRQKIWQDDSVQWWYRQNMLIYVHPRAASFFSQYEECSMLDVVHRSLWEYPAGLRYVIKQFPGALKRAIKKRTVSIHQ